MKTIAKTLVRAAAILILTAASAAPPAAAQTIAHIPADVVSSVRERVDKGRNVGIIVGIVRPDVVEYFAYGSTRAGGTTIPDEHSVFEIGSITKAFTGVLLADMVVRREVELDDPVRRYLPEAVSVPRWENAEISLEDLATHMSSLPRLPDNMAPADVSNPYADYTVDQMYAFLSRHELRREIGAEYEYSNLAVGLLGHVLAMRRGMPYEELLRARVLSPLGMDETAVMLTPEMLSRLARGHVNGEPVSNWDIPTLAGAGALRSTAHDMLRFLAANLGLDEAPEALRVDRNPLEAAMALSHRVHADRVANGMSVGLGWHVRYGDGVETVWHNGGTGGYRSFAGFNRDGDLGVVVLSNSATGADDIGFHLLDPSYPLMVIEVPAFPEEVAVPEEVLESYVGAYALMDYFMLTITLEDGRLHAQATGQARFPIYASSETEFFWKVVDARITFYRGENGIPADSLALFQGGTNLTGRRVNGAGVE